MQRSSVLPDTAAFGDGRVNGHDLGRYVQSRNVFINNHRHIQAAFSSALAELDLAGPVPGGIR